MSSTDAFSVSGPAPVLRSLSPPLVTVIIDNYNYDRFLRAAIESALCQTYSPVEVIVVDDGSTDTSRDIMEQYSERIIPVYQRNAGQAAAFNAGLARASGSVVVFLDADDMLMPDMVGMAMGAFGSNPALAKVQFRVELVDAEGAPLGECLPPAGVRLPQGDLRRQVLRFPDDIPYPPTSGNAFARWALDVISPIPEGAYDRIGADLYLCNLTSLVGPIASLDTVGAQYRSHGRNLHHVGQLEIEQVQRIIVRSCSTHRLLKGLADRLGLEGLPDDPSRVLSVTFLAHRAISHKLAPHSHPIPHDSLRLICRLGVRAAMGRFDSTVLRRLMYAIWFVIVLIAPPGLTRLMAEQFFHAPNRWRLAQLLASRL